MGELLGLRTYKKYMTPSRSRIRIVGILRDTFIVRATVNSSVIESKINGKRFSPGLRELMM